MADLAFTGKKEFYEWAACYLVTVLWEGIKCDAHCNMCYVVKLNKAEPTGKAVTLVLAMLAYTGTQ